jgi:hypothetical protein
MVHRREINGETIVFGIQGALWGNAMTWWDHDTGSVWSQPIGEAIAGPRTGQTIDLLPSEFTSWEAWTEAHPDTLALDAPAPPSGFDLGEMQIVVDFTQEVRAYPIPDLRRVGVVNDIVAGLELAVVSDPNEPERWAVFSRRVDDVTVVLELVEGELVDRASGTRFDPVRGLGRGGDLDGAVLNLLPGLTVFPADYDTFWPEGSVWRP